MSSHDSLSLALYASYIALGTGFTVWVGNSLFKNGRVFLLDAFERAELADSVNHLLLVGFYLINFGYTVMALRSYETLSSAVTVCEVLSVKIGGVILVLGGMHFFNLYIFSRMRRRTALKSAPPPVRPSQVLAQQGA